MSAVLTPTTLDEALVLLAEHPGALPLAGGTDLLVRLRSTTPDNTPPLVSLARIDELQQIVLEDTVLAIGAATPFSRIIDDPFIHAHAPLLARAAQTIGGPAIRNMATIGGNIRTASPAGDSLPPLLLYGANIEMVSPAGRRTLPIEAFILGPGQTALKQGEIITRILVPRALSFSHDCFIKIGRRQALAISVVSFAALVRLTGDNLISEIRMAWGSVGPTVVRLPALEADLTGAPVGSATIAHLRRGVHEGVSPISDLRASAEYRRLVAANLAARFVEALHG